MRSTNRNRRREAASATPVPLMVADLVTNLYGGSAIGAAPTFGRASTAYVQNFNGDFRLGAANESRFTGARRVQNLIAQGAAALNTVGWTYARATRNAQITGPDGRPYAQIMCDGGADPAVTPSAGLAPPGGLPLGGRTFVAQMWVYSDASQLVGDGTDDCRFYIYDSGVSSIGSVTLRVTTVPQLVTIEHTFPAGLAATTLVGARIDPFDGVGSPAAGKYIYASSAMVEEVTGQTIRTASPWQDGGNTDFGAGALGVAYYNTLRLHYQNLLQQSENFLVTWGTAATAVVALDAQVAPGGYAAYSVTDNAGNTSHRISQARPITEARGRSFTFEVLLKNVTKGTALVVITDQNFSARGQLQITNLATGVFAPSFISGMTGSVSLTDAGGGWWNAKVTATFPFDPATNIHALVYMSDNTSLAAYVGTGQSILVSRAALRVESAEVLSGYVPTTTAPVTVDSGRTVAIPGSTLKKLRVESDATNQVRNAAIVGAVAGSPGTLPTNWTDVDTTAVGLTRTVSLGTEDGLPYVDIRYSGTVTTAGNLRINTEKYGAAWPAMLTGETWTGSVYAKVAAGSLANLSAPIQGFEYGNAAGVYIAGKYLAGALPGNTARLKDARVQHGGTAIAEALVATFLNQIIQYSAALGVVDITIRIAAPQVEKKAFASSPIATTGAAATRNADILSFPPNGNTGLTTGGAYLEVTPDAGTLAKLSYFLALNGATTAIFGYCQPPALQTSDNTNFPLVAGALVAGTTYKIAMGYGGATQSVARSGPASVLDVAYDGTMGTAPLTGLFVGSNGSPGSALDGHIGCIRTYAQKPTNAQILSWVA